MENKQIKLEVVLHIPKEIYYGYTLKSNEVLLNDWWIHSGHNQYILENKRTGSFYFIISAYHFGISTNRKTIMKLDKTDDIIIGDKLELLRNIHTESETRGCECSKCKAKRRMNNDNPQKKKYYHSYNSEHEDGSGLCWEIFRYEGKDDKGNDKSIMIAQAYEEGDAIEIVNSLNIIK